MRQPARALFGRFRLWCIVSPVCPGRLVRVAEALDVPVMRLLDGIAGAARKSNTPPAVALIAHADPLRLVKAFATIRDRGVRRSLVTLAEGIARMAQHARTRSAALPSRPQTK